MGKRIINGKDLVERLSHPTDTPAEHETIVDAVKMLKLPAITRH